MFPAQHPGLPCHPHAGTCHLLSGNLPCHEDHSSTLVHGQERRGHAGGRGEGARAGGEGARAGGEGARAGGEERARGPEETGGRAGGQMQYPTGPVLTYTPPRVSSHTRVTNSKQGPNCSWLSPPRLARL